MKLLIVSDSPHIKTGLGRITNELAKRWQIRHEVHIAGWFDPIGPEGSQVNGYKIYRLPRRELGFEYIEPICRREQFDAVIAIGDPWYFGYLNQLKWLWKARSIQLPWIGYLTIDGDPLPQTFQKIIEGFDTVISCTHYGKQQLQTLTDKDISVIPFGVDGEVFRPLDRRQAIRQELRLQDWCVILLDAQNTTRKNIWALLKAFELFHADKPVCLYLFTNPDDPSGVLLRDMIWALPEDVRAKIIVSRQADPYQGLEDEELNALYNLADILVLPSMNEGFGLPLLQALAVGCFPIGTGYASIPELIGAFGQTVTPAAYFASEWGMRCAVLDPKALAEALGSAYHVWQQRRGFPEFWKSEARRYAMTFSWDRSAAAVEQLLLREGHHEPIGV